MDRKSVVMVRWLNTGRVEAYSSLVGFCASNPQYAPHRIYAKWEHGIFRDFLIELRRVPFIPNPYRTRRGGQKRAKPGPRRSAAKRRQ